MFVACFWEDRGLNELIKGQNNDLALSISYKNINMEGIGTRLHISAY